MYRVAKQGTQHINTISTMSSHHREESHAEADERAPLLANDNVQYDAATPQEEEDATLEPEKPSSRTWHYVCRAFWCLLTLLMIAIFVKGWIDADDVNVRSHAPPVPRLHGHQTLITTNRSLTSRAH